MPLSDKKEARLQLTAEIAARLASLNDPVVSKWFAAEDARIVANLLAARSDDERREFAAAANALRDLKAFIDGAIGAGDRARRDLDGMRT